MPDIYVNDQTTAPVVQSTTSTSVTNTQTTIAAPTVEPVTTSVQPKTNSDLSTKTVPIASPIQQNPQPTQNSWNNQAPAPISTQPMNPPIQNQWNDPWAAPMGAGGGSTWNDPWATGGVGGGGSTWNDPWANPAQNRQQSTAKKMTPEERVQMIEKLYQEVLGRKAETRDVNYYKYSTLAEDEIRRQLVTGKEHTELTNNGREYSNIKKRAEDAEGRVKLLDGQIRDQIEEFRKLAELLKEKNRFIQQLRTQTESPFTNRAGHSTDGSTQQYQQEFNPNISANYVPISKQQVQLSNTNQDSTTNSVDTIKSKTLQSRVISGLNRVIGV